MRCRHKKTTVAVAGRSLWPLPSRIGVAKATLIRQYCWLPRWWRAGGLVQAGALPAGLGVAMAIGSLAGKLSFNASSRASSAWLSLAGVGESRSGGGAGAVAALVLECMMIPSQ